jgi:hypothetical protein
MGMVRPGFSRAGFLQAGFLRGRLGGWTFGELQNRFLDFWAADGALTASAVPAGNGEAVQTWNDFSGQGNHIAAQNAGLRPAFSAAGGPIGQAMVSFREDQLRRASFTGGEVTDFVFIGIIKWTDTGLAVADNLFAGDGSPTMNLATLSSTINGNGQIVLQGAGSSGNTGQILFPGNQWALLVVEFKAGGGRYAFNDNQPRQMTNSPSACILNAISVGAAWSGTQGVGVDAVRMLFLDQPTLDDEDWSKVRTYAAKQLGVTFSNESRYFHDFTLEANTANNTIPLSPTGHAYQLTGGQLANVRILNGALTLISPFGTFYAWVQINFRPSFVAWEYNEISYGVGIDSTCAVILSKLRQDLNDMLHFVWSQIGWRLERYYPAGGASVIVAQRTYTRAATGRFEWEIDRNAGTILVTGADGVAVLCDWNGTAGAGTLADFVTNSFAVEVIGTALGQIVGYTEIEALP